MSLSHYQGGHRLHAICPIDCTAIEDPVTEIERSPRAAWLDACGDMPAERDTCRPYLLRELELLAEARVVVALGAFAYTAMWAALRARGARLPSPRPRFGHGIELDLEASSAGDRITMIGSFHPSQQNTFTGRLTEDMLDNVFIRAQLLLR